MALIKKQVFLRSRDENLQQFLAKAGDKVKPHVPDLHSMSRNLDDYRDKEPTPPRSVSPEKSKQGKMTLNEKSSGDKVNLVSESAFKKRYQEGKKAYDAKKAKSEPKSPWDDESDALDQGSDNSNTADDKASLKKAKGDATKVFSPRHAKAKIEEQDYKDWQREQAASEKSKATIGDNVDPATIVTKAIQDAWFEKAKGKQEKLNRRAGLRAMREKIDTDAMSPSEKTDFNKKADANMREANKNDPGLMYSAPQNVTSQDNRRYRSEIAAADTKKSIPMTPIQQAIEDAWLEKIQFRKPKTYEEKMADYERTQAALAKPKEKAKEGVEAVKRGAKAVKRRVDRTGVRNPLRNPFYDKGPKNAEGRVTQGSPGSESWRPETPDDWGGRRRRGDKAASSTPKVGNEKKKWTTDAILDADPKDAASIMEQWDREDKEANMGTGGGGQSETPPKKERGPQGEGPAPQGKKPSSDHEGTIETAWRGVGGRGREFSFQDSATPPKEGVKGSPGKKEQANLKISHTMSADKKKAVQGELIDMNSIQQGVYDAWIEKQGDASKADAAKASLKIREDLKRKAAAEEQAQKDFKASKYSKTDDVSETGGWPTPYKGPADPPRPKGQ